MKKYLILALIFSVLSWPSQNVLAVESLTNVSLTVSPQIAGETATWKISFTMPQSSQVGHVLISLGGLQPDLSAAELFVAGLPAGNAVVGKSNPNCVFNCDDIRYIFKVPVSIKKNTVITFTLNKVKNSSQEGQTGLNFIDVYNSKYPDRTLAFNTGEKLISLAAANEIPPEELIPNTATNESANETTASIKEIILSNLFFKEGAKTTKLTEIKDPAKVEDFTLDLIDKVRVTFKGTLDLSKPESLIYIQNLSDYLTFEKLKFSVKQEVLYYFKVPLEVTFYNLPFIWQPDIKKDAEVVLTKDKIAGYNFFFYNNQPQLTMVVNEAGEYLVIPHFELQIKDYQEIKSDSNSANFNGRISDPQSIIKISLNGKELTDLKPIIDIKTGEFSFKVDLLEGSNLIQAVAESNYGNSDKISKVVYYIPNTKKPSTTPWIHPANLIAVGLAILAIVLIILLRKFLKKKRI